jgi:hypothetical protein
MPVDADSGVRSEPETQCAGDEEGEDAEGDDPPEERNTVGFRTATRWVRNVGVWVVVVFESFVRQIESVVARRFVVPAGTFVGAALRTGAGVGRHVGTADGAFGGCGEFSFLGGGHAPDFLREIKKGNPDGLPFELNGTALLVRAAGDH